MIKQSDVVELEYPDYLNDESGLITNGNASKIFFPKNEKEMTEICNKSKQQSIPITISGGGTGLAGGRVPLGGWIIATDEMKTIISHDNDYWTDPETKITYGLSLKKLDTKNALLTVPVSMTVKAIQNYTREKGWFYPPDPTERSCFIGGNVNTNASGARSFKYKVTRDWIYGIRVLLQSGEIVKFDRDNPLGTISDKQITFSLENKEIIIDRPSYTNPNVTKNVAGLVIKDYYQPMDLFIGTGGLFGITTEVTLKLIRVPNQFITIFAFCKTREQALQLVEICQEQKNKKIDPIPLAVEYLDDRAVKILHSKEKSISEENQALIILEQDIQDETQIDVFIQFWLDQLDGLGIDETMVAQTYSEIEKFKELRHTIPETVNSMVRANGQPKLGSDCALPISKHRLLHTKAIELGNKFEDYQNSISPLRDNIGYAIWAHAGDAHIHLNLIPRSNDETLYAKKIMVELIEFIVKEDGTIAAEHGLGKKRFGGKLAISYQIGQEGINDIKKIKRILDPLFLLNRVNLIGYE